MYNSIHWTTCAPLISAWNYFTTAGYAFSHKNYTNAKPHELGPGFHGGTWTTTQLIVMQRLRYLILFTFILYMLVFPFLFCCLFKFLCVVGICTGFLIVIIFPSPIIMQDHNNSNQRHLQWLGYMTLVCHSQATTFSNRAGKVKSASISHIYIWTNDSPVGWLWPSKYSTCCNRGWCIVLVGNWSWWLTQYDTLFHSLIAAPSWIGHKPTETWPPCLYMTHFVTEKSLLDIKQLWKAIVNGCICQQLLHGQQGCQESCLYSTLRKKLTSVTYPGESTVRFYSNLCFTGVYIWRYC